jgi:tRNA 2-selenouridine synthase
MPELTDDFARIALERTPILDVRAPVEFAEGALPHSVNIPILENEERAHVGTVYKQEGSEAAIALGHRLVSGAVKESRIEAWHAWLAKNPQALITCFRGGMRSGLAQEWLAGRGVERPRIKGGYKAMRRFYLEQLDALPDHPWLVISGPTGAGKTSLLQEVARPKLDLEKIARHRGSAFGAYGQPQPSQATFENEVAAELLQLSQSAPEVSWLIEDESRMIGARVMPEKIFLALRISPIVLIEDDLDTRVENTFAEYVAETDLSGRAGEERAQAKLREYEQAVMKISPKLGGLRAQEILSLLHGAKEPDDHRAWIRKLIQEYYDPFYFNSLAQREKQVAFRGKREEVKAYLGAP